MRITAKRAIGQLCLIVFAASFITCNAGREDVPVIPPVTSPLSRDYIGFGVITASFTHITSEPSDNSPSIGYLRRGDLVRVIRRQVIKIQNNFVSWVHIDSNLADTAGWLKEDVMNIYDNESQARTASESALR
ncbi:MAG: hypothetical protein FWB83_00625 [Treponema sp.]|nr:hypothetical protein [Treponema sp.]